MPPMHASQVRALQAVCTRNACFVPRAQQQAWRPTAILSTFRHSSATPSSTSSSTPHSVPPTSATSSTDHAKVASVSSTATTTSSTASTSASASVKDTSSSESTAAAADSASDWTRTDDVGVQAALRSSFADAQQSFSHLSTTELLRANVVLQACGLAGPLVPYIDKLYGAAVSVTGTTLVHGVMRPTAFAHFCGGEAAKDMLPKLKSLQEYGVGGILDYAAEAKEGSVEMPTNARYDSQIDLFKDAISVAAEGGSDYNLVAIKVSALCDIPLLIKASKGMVEAQRTFFRLAEACGEPGQEDAWGVPFAASSDTVLDAEAFKRGFPDGCVDLKAVDVRGRGHVDLVDWTSYWTPSRISEKLSQCKCSETFPVLSPAELTRLSEAEERINTVGMYAREHGVRLLVDAEWTKSQPAMDYLALRVAAQCNVVTAQYPNATVLQTYQTYLRGSLGRCERDLALAEREGWAFGGKIVRGAYIVQERAEAAEAGRVSPIWDTLPLTEENFHATITACLSSHRQGNQVMVASHNPDSLLFTVRMMSDLKLDPKESGVLFGQLLGMAEAVSFSLAKHGYRVFKYMPYGPLDEVVPYLLRRTQENSTLLGSPAVSAERHMLAQEVFRRATGGFRLPFSS